MPAKHNEDLKTLKNKPFEIKALLKEAQIAEQPRLKPNS
jgi:hypothetical protein